MTIPMDDDNGSPKNNLNLKDNFLNSNKDYEEESSAYLEGGN